MAFKLNDGSLRLGGDGRESSPVSDSFVDLLYDIVPRNLVGIFTGSQASPNMLGLIVNRGLSSHLEMPSLELRSHLGLPSHLDLPTQTPRLALHTSTCLHLDLLSHLDLPSHPELPSRLGLPSHLGVPTHLELPSHTSCFLHAANCLHTAPIAFTLPPLPLHCPRRVSAALLHMFAGHLVLPERRCRSSPWSLGSHSSACRGLAPPVSSQSRH